MLTLAVAIGLLIGVPQWARTLIYLPKSVRWRTHKSAVGTVPVSRLLKSLINPLDRRMVNDVFWTECAPYVGILALVFALWTPSWRQWLALGTIIIATICPWFCPSQLRIPARFTYFVALILSFMAVGGLASRHWSAPILAVVCLIQGWDLCLRTSVLWPMRPFCQRTDRPSRLFQTPLTKYLTAHLDSYRVSGLPYPLRTGQVHSFRTLGYNGASQLRAMANFRQGEGEHDWFHRQPDGPAIDWYGVKYAYTYRDLSTLWNLTPIPHLWENPHVTSTIPSFYELERIYG